MSRPPPPPPRRGDGCVRRIALIDYSAGHPGTFRNFPETCRGGKALIGDNAEKSRGKERTDDRRRVRSLREPDDDEGNRNTAPGPGGGGVEEVSVRPVRRGQDGGGDHGRRPAEPGRDGERRLRGVRMRPRGV